VLKEVAVAAYFIAGNGMVARENRPNNNPRFSRVVGVNPFTEVPFPAETHIQSSFAERKFSAGLT